MAGIRKKLVVIGNGMAGVNTLEHVGKEASDQYEITVFGSEPYPNYNRIMLSYVLEGSKTIDDIILNPLSWYEENGITLKKGVTVERIDTTSKLVYATDGTITAYDACIIATGSKPFILPIPGVDKEGVVGFRDISDCEAMLSAAKTYKKAAVIGGGLLGLEAAKGLCQLGMEVTVVHLAEYLMERQLDPTAARMLQTELERQGLKFLTSTMTSELLGGNRVTGLRFKDGSELEADFVVMAAGIIPNIDVAKASNITCGRGIEVDDYMRTSAPGVYAVGECNQHRGVCYGLVAPLYEQGAILAKHLVGTESAPYEGSVVATKLKVSGVDVFSAGEFMDQPDLTIIRMQDGYKGLYKKIMLRNNVIVGGVLFGDVSDSSRLDRMIRTQTEMTEEIYASFMGTQGNESGGANLVAEMSNDEIVCGCMGVTKGMIVSAIKDKGCMSVDEIKAVTGASRSCGGCKPLVGQILEYQLGDEFDPAANKAGICGCTKLSRDELVAAIQEKGLRTTKEVMNVLDWATPEGCSKCRPAVNYYLNMLYPGEYEDERESRFVNERLHGNIQKDSTFTVVPRMYGGMTTVEQLRKIANVAEKYNADMLKVTGGQRIDILGIKKDDLPKVWEELDMPSGFAYAKSLRTVKTCVGKLHCRYGTVDSVNTGIAIERKFERIDFPAKFKMAVNGCPRSCAEACTKDIGIVGNDGGWEIYVGGNGGIKPRMADLLCKVKTDEELMEVCGAFMQMYRESGQYGERTSEWVERIGLESIQKAVVDDIENRKGLMTRIEAALAHVHEPWSRVINDQETRQKLYGEPVVADR
ncbi:nitrite reductase large subunit NirB [Brevibacillus daliensis]|uniref:nitrite reductase large subunit NirB n=1 Tax=Brevibacillus daliensis TaxID=2892995 RepID=UPI0021046D36|nr:nitrite reductase large subunit NirB [Brevibacillus daliensis]